MKRFLLCFTIAIILLTKELYASTEYAYSIGTNYSTLLHWDVNTSKDATYAADMFAISGYKSYYNIKPTVEYFKGKAPNNVRRLGSEVVFFSGHGSSSRMIFNYKRKGGKFATGICRGRNTESGGYDLAGIEDCDMSRTKLMVFAGCNTASDYDNITYDATKHGVDCAIGWTKTVEAKSHSKWLKRFVERLAAGYTVKGAKDYANTFDYDDKNVKSAYLYGKIATKICGGKEAYIKKNSQCENDRKNVGLSDKKVNINDFLDALEYDRQVSFMENVGEGVIDFKATIDGININMGYTALVNNGIITDVYGEINWSTYMKIKESFRCPKITSEYLNRIKQKEKNKLNMNMRVVSQEYELIYDVNNDKFEIEIFTDYILGDTNTYGRVGGKYEIK